MKKFKKIISVVLSTSFIFSSSLFVNGEVLNAKDVLGTYYDRVVNAGIISANPENVTVSPAVTGDNVKIMSVDTLGENLILVTLDGRMDNFDFGDLSLKAYESNWWNLKANLKDRITVKNTSATVNDKGNTVLLFEIEEKIDNNRLVQDKGENTVLGNLEKNITIADNYVTWQMSHGGWDKGIELHETRPWNGTERKNASSGWRPASGYGDELGTIDNDATYTHMLHIAKVYAATNDSKYKDSVLKGLDFIFKLQTEKGGMTQVYPKRGSYSDYVTFNDNAMANVLNMLLDMRDGVYPFHTDIITPEYKEKINTCIDKATDYILKAQLLQNGVKTAWCAQHDPVTYEARGARAYELPSISGSETIAVVKYLMRIEQTPEVKEAVDCAIAWLKKSELKNTAFDNKDPNGEYFKYKEGSSVWYRFYEISNNDPIFADRDGSKYTDISKISEERRTGYSWAGNWPKKLLDVYDRVGYYPDKIVLSVVENNSVSTEGKRLNPGDTISPEKDNLVNSLDTPNPPVTDKIYGDANLDGILVSADAASVLQNVLDSDSFPLTTEQFEVADVTGDNILTASDASNILSKVLNSDFIYPMDSNNK